MRPFLPLLLISGLASAGEANTSLTLGTQHYEVRVDGSVSITSTGADGASATEVRHFEGQAYGLTVIDGQPWVLLRTTEAKPLSGSAIHVDTSPAGVPAAAPIITTPAEITRGTVTQAGIGTAVIDKGIKDGLDTGDRVKVIARREVDGSALGQTGANIVREIEVGEGVVTLVSEDRSLLQLGRGSRAVVGDVVEVLPEGSGPHNIAPPRLGGITDVGVTLRPFMAVGNLGVGSINEVGITYLFEKPWFVEARLQPMTLGWSTDGNLIGVAAIAAGGYDNPLFGIGLGLGFTAANTGITGIGSVPTPSYDDGAGGGSFENVEPGLSVAQIARLGSRDGLHLEVRNTFVLGTVEEYQYDECYYYGECTEPSDPVLVDTYKEFRWSSTRGRLVLPVASTTDLFTEIGGGAAPYFSVEGGVQTWIRGNGDRGSLGASVAAGYGYMEGNPQEDRNVELAGPLLSLGLRWRL